MRRLLIANRGEIAVRIARTAERLGIETVGVYSEPDANGLHVDAVDLAVALGGSTATESYLRADAILEAAAATDCDALHPGYGFLAESADFAEQVIAAGLTWVGPTPDQIRTLGDKVSAKRAALEAGVPTTEIIEIADGTVPSGATMPALIKAAAGGGGRGMRIVRTAGELAEGIEAAAREANAAFGDGTVFLEPYIERGRHIEVQIIGDRHGNVVHLGERECSIQRRNQKIVEEAPSAGIDAPTRARLCDAAVALARHVGYENAGTVEFMVGDDGTITFLEVNTRLQVEHPVTEAVTGLDLVELQLRAARGEPLGLEQSDIGIDGHAIEVRLVAEDPARGWMPSTGHLDRFEIGPGSRVDTGVRTGAEVTPFYDSMIAKVITHAPTRAGAAARMARSLRTSLVTGVATNREALAAIMGEPDFLAAATPTAYLDEHPEILEADDGPTAATFLIAAAVALETHHIGQNPATGFAPSGWRNLATRGQRRTFRNGDTIEAVEYRFDGDTALVLIGSWPEPSEEGSLPVDERSSHRVRVLDRSGGRLALEVDGVRERLTATIVEGDEGPVVELVSRTSSAVLALVPAFSVPDRATSGSGPICPLPGTVIAVHAEVGDQVRDGDLLMVVEAMKMEHRITATADAVVTEVHFAAGDRVDTGDLLVSLESPD